MRNHALEAVRSYYHKVLPFYDDENSDRADLAFWRGLCLERKPRSILELGAGSGRVTVVLANEAPVVALDLSIEMLQRAAKRLAGKPAFLVMADMRRFALARRFDLIVAPNDPFAHLTRRRERQIALRLIARHLAPGGRLVIDGLYRPERKRVDLPERSENGVSIRESWMPLGTDNRWHARYAYERGAARVEAEFVARAWDRHEVDTIFAAAGLEVKEIWGDFERHPFTPGSERILVAADRSRAARQGSGTEPYRHKPPDQAHNGYAS